MWIRKYFFRIRGSVILNYGSGSKSSINYRSYLKNFVAIEKKIDIKHVVNHEKF
jgi:hypothetical protein